MQFLYVPHSKTGLLDIDFIVLFIGIRHGSLFGTRKHGMVVHSLWLKPKSFCLGATQGAEHSRIRNLGRDGRNWVVRENSMH